MCRLYEKFASYFSSYKWPYCVIQKTISENKNGQCIGGEVTQREKENTSWSLWQNKVLMKIMATERPSLNIHKLVVCSWFKKSAFEKLHSALKQLQYLIFLGCIFNGFRPVSTLHRGQSFFIIRILTRKNSRSKVSVNYLIKRKKILKNL